MAFALLARLFQPAAETRAILLSAIDKDGAPVMGLDADDILIEDGQVSGRVFSVTPASFPVAIVVDTSSFARGDFQALREAVHRFAGALAGRDVALYTSGTPATREVSFTRDIGRVQAGIDHLFAHPNSAPRRLDALLDAAHDLKAREAPVSRILMVSAGGPDSSARAPADVIASVFASRSIVDVVDWRHDTQSSGDSASAYDPRRPVPRLRTDTDADVLRGLCARTLGRYERIVSASGYGAMLARERVQVLSEVVVQYTVPAETPHNLRVGVGLPGVLVRGVGLPDGVR